MATPSSKMPSTLRDWQQALFIPLTILAWLVLIVIAIWLLSHITKTILTLALSAIVAFALRPLVVFFRRFMPRGWAIALAYLIGFTIIFGMLSLIILTAADQVAALATDLPKYFKPNSVQEDRILTLLHPFHVSKASYQNAIHQAVSHVQDVGKIAATQSIDIITGVLGTIVDVILVLILSVYLTIDGERLAQWLRRQTPLTQRRNTTLLFAIINQVVGGYIRGTLTLASLIGLLVGVGMYAIGVKYAVLLGVLAFFMEFVPVIGVLVSGAISIALALLGGWVRALIVLIYFVFVHIIEGDVVGPRIMGKAVGIHPATALVALVAGTELFGIWGALFAAPLAGLLQAVGTAAWQELHGAHPDQILQTVVEKTEVQASSQAEESLQREHESKSTEGAGGSTATR
jgi:predicted PurR-regulated permease PerM